MIICQGLASRLGYLISFEGIEGCGKSTQAKLLAKQLESSGRSCLLTQEPGGTQIGREIRKVLLHPAHHRMVPEVELALYFADRAQHLEEIILPALDEGRIVITDRFTDSSIAYQGYGRRLDIHWIEQLNKRATQGISPELTFLLDIDPELAKKRSKEKDRIENEEIAFHQRVRQGYLEIAHLYPNRVKTVNGQDSIKNIHLAIRKILSEYL